MAFLKQEARVIERFRIIEVAESESVSRHSMIRDGNPDTNSQPRGSRGRGWSGPSDVCGDLSAYPASLGVASSGSAAEETHPDVLHQSIYRALQHRML
jgi:hypothetical protein